MRRLPRGPDPHRGRPQGAGVVHLHLSGPSACAAEPDVDRALQAAAAQRSLQRHPGGQRQRGERGQGALPADVLRLQRGHVRWCGHPRHP